MRTSFINPMHLPIVTETYLRKDFNFALYQGHCYGKTLTKFFDWTLSSTFWFFGVTIFTTLILVILGDPMIYSLLQFFCVAFSFIFLLCIRATMAEG